MYRQSLKNICILSAIAIVLLCASGCSRRKAMEQLHKAEATAEHNPAEALSIIASIDSDDICGKHNKARYTLVLSETLYHNYIDTLSEATTRPMMEYYLDSERHDERARALYQHALVLNTQGQLAEAMVMLLEAEQSLQHIDDTKLTGLIHRTKGDIYSDGCLFANALESYRLARDSFDTLGLSYHSASVTYDMGGTMIQLRDFEGAAQALNEALTYGITEDNRPFICAVLHELLDLSIYQGDYEACLEYINAFDKHDCLLYGESHYHAMCAMVESYYGDMHKALAMLDEAMTMEDSEWADLEYARYIIYRNGGASSEALYWNEKSKHAQDRLMLSVLEQPVLNLQVDMLRQSLDSERREKELTAERNTVIFIIIALIITAIVAYAIYRIRRKESELAHYIEMVSELRDTLDSIPKDMASSVSELYRDRFSELNELCDIYYDHEGSTRNKSLVFNKLTETIEAIKSDNHRLSELEATVNTYRGGIMQRLREQMPKLSERDMRVALYVFAGFSNRAIAIFIESDPVSVSKIRYNIKQKIRSANIADGEILMAALTDKK